ncbi:hypothetical protein [Microbacterium sp.]|uniref:hypothetical protein n=1 Tax=Microbacterium sp. TaxID=51671 RepID=UPI003A918149
MLGFHTINARHNQIFHWIFDRVGGDAAAFRNEMQREAEHIRQLLRSGGVNYDDLKSALVPTREGLQAVFLYDWWEDPSWNYAVAFASAYLPHLRPTIKTSMRHGDLLDRNRESGETMPLEQLKRMLVQPDYREVSWNTQYAVYFNNLKRSDIDSIHSALAINPRYMGYIDVSFRSAVRDYLDWTVAPAWVINGKRIILSHGGDDPWVDTQNPMGFDFDENGFSVTSLVDTYFTAFMTYKVESSSTAAAREDRLFNLAAVTGELIDIDSTDVYVHPDKLDRYLLRDESKLRLMTSVGLETVTPTELGAILKQKIELSYICDLRFASDGTPVFAVPMEFEKPDGIVTRRRVSLKHDEAQGQISLVTMY